jgi:hypothetical protein
MITTEQEAAIRDVLATMPKLAVGVGTKEQACSIAALNLALTGTLTDDVPDCMSLVIGRWIIAVQDKMPATIRDSAAWRELLVMAAGTGREHEAERKALALSWMWEALAVMQPRADADGYGKTWATMLRERTAKAAASAADAAADAAASAAYIDADAYAAASAADAAADAAAYADAADAAADAAASAAYADAYAAASAAYAAADAAASAAGAAADAAAAAGYAYADADADAYAVASAAYAAAGYAAAWQAIDPVGCLRRLVAVTFDEAVTKALDLAEAAK